MMVKIILLIGILITLISLYFIIKNDNSEKKYYEEILSIYEEIKKYGELSRDTMAQIDGLIKSTSNLLNDNSYESKRDASSIDDAKSSQISKQILFNDIEDKNNINYAEKVIELKNIGLTNEEIAKKLGKGIREVDIMLKMNKNNIGV
jgi:hypothetical protein